MKIYLQLHPIDSKNENDVTVIRDFFQGVLHIDYTGKLLQSKIFLKNNVSRFWKVVLSNNLHKIIRTMAVQFTQKKLNDKRVSLSSISVMQGTFSNSDGEIAIPDCFSQNTGLRHIRGCKKPALNF